MKNIKDLTITYLQVGGVISKGISILALSFSTLGLVGCLSEGDLGTPQDAAATGSSSYVGCTTATALDYTSAMVSFG